LIRNQKTEFGTEKNFGRPVNELTGSEKRDRRLLKVRGPRKYEGTKGCNPGVRENLGLVAPKVYHRCWTGWSGRLRKTGLPRA